MITVPGWSLVPFVIMLLAIALGPIFFEHWWENNRNKLIVSLVLGIPTAIYLVICGLSSNLIHQLIFDYIPFIALLGALFVITGGIHLNGDIEAKPKTNVIFIALGAILSSFIGTTGSAMLLIRPLIRTNAERKYKVHTILFFIAVVANCGGLLTPLGDPPLFLLYLKGAPFTWFFHLVPEWALTNLLLIIIYFVVDSHYYKKEEMVDLWNDRTNIEPIKLSGKLNFLWLLGVVLSVAFINGQYIHLDEEGNMVKLVQVIALLLLAACSLIFTKKEVRQDNKFSWAPITEVAFLFLGIFTTMVPALLFLNANATSLGLSKAWQFYYATGALSSCLDNAPTALAFHSVASGLNIVDGTIVAGIPDYLLAAISVGAVFFGAMTYIGNGPNFMVKSIAEENKIKMPSFFGYMIKFSLIVLLPVYVIVQLICL